MADRAMMFCPRCDAQNSGDVELMRENHNYSCMFGHQINGYENLMLLNPRLIPLQFHEKAGINDVKTEFWIDKDVLQKFREKYPNQQNSTVNSILSVYLTGDVVIVDGKQAAELKKSGVKNGAEMVAVVQASKALEEENDSLKEKLDFLRSMFSKADVESPV